MDTLERLAAIFERFPGIGPRQANRFVQFLLRSSPAARKDLIETISALGGAVRQCPECMRFHASEKALCGICANPERDSSSLAVVASDSDLAALERSGTYSGRYFVLGGTISLASEEARGLRLKQLIDAVKKRTPEGLSEIILAFPANPEGDATASRLREELTDIEISITTLGRGLSTGSELEYADPDTIKSALESRK